MCCFVLIFVALSVLQLSRYDRHQRVRGAIGVKLVADGIEHVVAGTDLLVYKPEYVLIADSIVDGFQFQQTVHLFSVCLCVCLTNCRSAFYYVLRVLLCCLLCCLLCRYNIDHLKSDVMADVANTLLGCEVCACVCVCVCCVCVLLGKLRVELTSTPIPIRLLTDRSMAFTCKHPPSVVWRR
jgi:hypothetical protein